MPAAGLGMRVSLGLSGIALALLSAYWITSATQTPRTSAHLRHLTFEAATSLGPFPNPIIPPVPDSKPASTPGPPPSSSPGPTAGSTPTPSPSTSPGGTPTPSPSPTPTPSPSPSPTPGPSRSPSPSPAPAPPPKAPPSSGDPIVAAAGDIACDPNASGFNGGNGTSTACRQRYTSDLLVAKNYAAVLAVGDLQYDNGAFDKFMASYDETWGRVKAKTYPAVGNHEYLTSGAAGYFQYFGSRAGSPSKGYYSFSIGSWHIVSLNSNCAPAGGCGAGSAQEQWLRTDLAAHPTSCSLAYWHHPRFSSGKSGNNTTYDALFRALYDGGAEVLLVGHDHLYERFGPQNPSAGADPARGVREFIVGTGGAETHSFAATRPNSEVRNNTTFGVLELTLHPSSYDWRFVPEAGRSFTDQGSASCH